jgi:hypothetical protein
MVQLTEVMRTLLKGTLIVLSLFSSNSLAIDYNSPSGSEGGINDLMLKVSPRIDLSNKLRNGVRLACAYGEKMVVFRLFLINFDGTLLDLNQKTVPCPVHVSENKIRNYNVIDYFVFDNNSFRTIIDHDKLFSLKSSRFDVERFEKKNCYISVRQEIDNNIYARVFDFSAKNENIISNCYFN